jgi:hypothetical protein
MNTNVRLLVQFLVTTELLALLVWLLHTVIHQAETINPTVRDVVVTVLYQIVPLVTAAVGYWIGSSVSSASKDHLIARIGGSS